MKNLNSLPIWEAYELPEIPKELDIKILNESFIFKLLALITKNH